MNLVWQRAACMPYFSQTGWCNPADCNDLCCCTVCAGEHTRVLSSLMLALLSVCLISAQLLHCAPVAPSLPRFCLPLATAAQFHFSSCIGWLSLLLLPPLLLSLRATLLLQLSPR